MGGIGSPPIWTVSATVNSLFTFRNGIPFWGTQMRDICSDFDNLRTPLSKLRGGFEKRRVVGERDQAICWVICHNFPSRFLIGRIHSKDLFIELLAQLECGTSEARRRNVWLWPAVAGCGRRCEVVLVLDRYY